MKDNHSEESKKAAGEKAADYVKDGMTVGLGTGSTVRYFIEKLAARSRHRNYTSQQFPRPMPRKNLPAAWE